MKKLYILICILLLTPLYSCSETIVEEENYEEFDEYYDLYEIYYDVFIICDSFSELETYMNYNTTYVFNGRASCPYCQLYLPLVAEYAYNNDLKIIYYNLDYDRDNYYYIDEDNKTIINEETDYYKYVSLLANNDSNITTSSSDKDFCKLATLSNGDKIPWLFIPRLFRFENGLPIKSCFTINKYLISNAGFYPTTELKEFFISEMNENTR